MTTKKPVLKRVRFTYEVLCHLDVNTETMELADVIRECGDGEVSGITIGDPEVKLLTLQQAAQACVEHGTDAEFFGLAAFEIGTRVWWTDPDEGHSSGWWKIVGWIQGDTYQMTNRAGGECEALEHELSLRKPKKGKK